MEIKTLLAIGLKAMLVTPWGEGWLEGDFVHSSTLRKTKLKYE